MKMNRAPIALSRLSNRQVIQKGDRAVRSRHELAVEIIDCLIEIERRSLYLKEGYSSLFSYCTRRWNYSPPKAGRTIAAARCVNAFPAVRTLLVERKITLCGVSRIAGILTAENCEELLRRVSGKRFVEIERIAALHRAAPPIRDSVRPIGVRRLANREKSADGDDFFQTSECGSTGRADRTEFDESNSQIDSKNKAIQDVKGKGCSQFDSKLLLKAARDEHRSQIGSKRDDRRVTNGTAPADPPTEEAIVERRYEIRFSASDGFLQKLERAKAVCSRRFRLEAILEKGLDELLERYDAERKQERRERRKSQKRKGERRGVRHPRSTPDNQRLSEHNGELEDRDAGRDLFQQVYCERESSERRARACGGAPPNVRDQSKSGASPASGDSTIAEPSRGDRGPVLVGGSPNGGDPAPKGRSRHIPAGLRDSVFRRDGGRCTFTGKNGVRCDATAHLQIDHIKPFCRGGEHTPKNLRLLCGKHNRLVAGELSLSS